jgi:hexokinase
MPMGKGFAITSDLNLGNILLAGYERHTRRPNGTSEPTAKRRKRFPLPKLKIAAITNDTVATLASLAYQVKSLPNSRVAMGIIVGTGCNATIPMKLSDLNPQKAEQISRRSPSAEETVVNTEWTIGGAAPPLHDLGITTQWDKALDAASARPGFQPFEYMTGGRYIGELVRIILHDYFTTIANIPSSCLPPLISTPQSLTTLYLSSVVARTKNDNTLSETLQADHPPPEGPFTWTPQTAKVLRKTAFVVQTRSAGMTASATVGLLACCGEITLEPLKKDTPQSNSTDPATESAPEPPTNATLKNLTLAHKTRDGLSPAPIPHPTWHSGPEELVVAYTGGIIQHYPHWKDTCQRFIDRLVMRGGPQDSGKSVFLREASDGGIIGAGVLAGTVLGGR